MVHVVSSSTHFPTRRVQVKLSVAMTSLLRLRLFAATAARNQLRTLHSIPFRHKFSLSLSHNSRPSFPHRHIQLLLIPSRSISLGSIFSAKPSPTPSPHAVAHVARIEADANAHPYDVEKQLSLFKALADTNIQPAYELVINRWERMSEFVRPLSRLSNVFADPAFAVYILGPCFTPPPFGQGLRVLSSGSAQGEQRSIDQSCRAQARVSPCRSPAHHTVIRSRTSSRIAPTSVRISRTTRTLHSAPCRFQQSTNRLCGPRRHDGRVPFSLHFGVGLPGPASVSGHGQASRSTQRWPGR